MKKKVKKALKRYGVAARLGDTEAQFNLANLCLGEPESLIWFRTAANQGHVRAQHSLGTQYDLGSVPGYWDHIEAVKWYRMAAEAGDAESQFELGYSYAKGKGVPEDAKEAVKWYRKAVDNGSDWAKYWLGEIYDNGEGVPQDYKEAVKWYRKAADQGIAMGQFSLGVMYAKGKGVPKDYVQSYAWYNLANENSDYSRREPAAESRKDLAEKMTPDQIARALELSKELGKNIPVFRFF
jgi:TPR repeat protein